MTLPVILVILFITWKYLLLFIFPDVIQSTLPSFTSIIPGVLACIVLSQLKSPYSRLLAAIWLAWYFIGIASTISSSIVLGNYYSQLELDSATQIYLWGATCYLFGIYLYEKMQSTSLESQYGNAVFEKTIQPMTAFILIAFPFFWLISIQLSIGHIPILSGQNITDSMYEISYGPLYPYGIVIAISIIFTGYKTLIESSNNYKLLYGLLCAIFIAISMADGKRAIAMISVIGLLAISFRLLRERAWVRTLPLLSAAIVVLYIGMQILRSDSDSSKYNDIYARLTIIGVEFRDFVFTVNLFEPGDIPNYSWATSTLASMTNGFILTLLGLNKAELTSLDSAHAWAAIWDTPFGIRTGIVSELWFAYSYLYLLFLLLIGLLSGFVIKKIQTSHNEFNILFFMAFFGLLALMVTGQSTFTAGVLPVFLYFYIALHLANTFFRK